MTNWIRLVALALAAASLGGCATRRYPVSGMILQVDKQRQTLLVSHERIPGYMDAMAMPFRVRDAKALELLRPGMRIEFQLVVNNTESWAERVRLKGGAQFEADPQAPAPQPSHAVALGQPVPDFELTDQSQRPVKLSQFAGKVVAVTFIYTRCPLPDYCPRLSDNFARLQERFGDRVGRDLTLLTVTFDPQYDRPEVLAAYGRGWKANPDGWRFLTGPMREIRRVCGMFGVDFWPDEGQITHSLRTALIDRQGRLAANLPGSDFTPRQLGDLVQNILNTP
ncbi:MAG: SCO family protein [Acidobacteria bacterium]|nr:SCO family protein [Acidobacteriota bacterium]